MTRLARVPRGDTAIYEALSQMFRAGQMYAFSYEGGVWSTWTTEHDFRHELRNGRRRCACCAPEMSPAGAQDWPRARLVAWLGLDVPAPRKLTRAQLVARLREVDGLPAAALELLEQAA